MTDAGPQVRGGTPELHVVIVGGGPTAVYAVSHLAAVLPEVDLTTPVRLSLIERSIPDSESEALVAIHPNEALIKVGSSTIYSRLVEGRFMQVKQAVGTTRTRAPQTVEFLRSVIEDLKASVIE